MSPPSVAAGAHRPLGSPSRARGMGQAALPQTVTPASTMHPQRLPPPTGGSIRGAGARPRRGAHNQQRPRSAERVSADSGPGALRQGSGCMAPPPMGRRRSGGRGRGGGARRGAAGADGAIRATEHAAAPPVPGAKHSGRGKRPDGQAPSDWRTGGPVSPANFLGRGFPRPLGGKWILGAIPGEWAGDAASA